MAEQLTGQITVSSAGTAEQGPSSPSGREFIICALPGNSGNVALGNDGSDDVTMSNGLVLSSGTCVTVTFQGGAPNALSAMWFDAATGGDGFSWFKLR